MSVWYCIPSARPPEEAEPVLREWRERGYKIALWREDWLCDTFDLRAGMDPDKKGFEPFPYPGYARAVNELAESVLKYDPACNWIVTGGDDILPDPNHSAEEIARECSQHFTAVYTAAEILETGRIPDKAWHTFGVMQPTGDRDFGDHQGPYCDRVAGSPWIGREWCLRANQGKGPLYPGFAHMFEDECLQLVAQQLGVFWQRPDLIHKHLHWGRPREGEKFGQYERMPEHLKKWNTRAHWDESKALLDRLRADGFRECMPL